MLELLKAGRNVEPIALAKKAKKPETKMSRRMKSGRRRELAQAFAIH
jgi:hypothetical protein